jgi:hypothetical protein
MRNTHSSITVGAVRTVITTLLVITTGFHFFIPVQAQKKTATSSTLDYNITPTYGEISLGNDFGTDPHSVTIVAGGAVNSNYLGGECSGFVSEGPDFRLIWEGAPARLIFYFEPNEEGADPTILVSLPDGAWECNDDIEEGNLNPMALVSDAQPGQYDIWVGSYGEGDYIEGTLHIADADKLVVENKPSLDFSLDPQYGSFNLKENFSPDPFIVSGISGGDMDVKEIGLGTECFGFASQAPDFRLNWTGSTTNLKIKFEANEGGEDTILIINTPSGEWLCNDDATEDTLNPTIDLTGQEEGQYDIWVASLSSGSYVEGKLIITER